MTRTVLAEGYGGPEVLAVQDIVLPAVATGQVLVDVEAAGANPVDYKLYSGDLAHNPDKLPMPIGMEVAGVIATNVVGMRAEKSSFCLSLAP